MRRHHVWNNITNPIVLRSQGVLLLSIWESSVAAWDAHLLFGDCTH